MEFKDDRVSALLLGRRAARLVPFPGSLSEEGSEPIFVGVRPLLESDLDLCRIDAAQYVKARAAEVRLDVYDFVALSSGGTDVNILQAEVRRAMVYRAYVVSEDVDKREPAKFFPSIAAVRGLEADVFRELYEQYEDVVDSVSPTRGVTNEQVQELADAIPKELRARASLLLCDAGSRLRLLRTLVSPPTT